MVSATGGPPRALNGGLAITGNPIWSPDGKSVLVFGIDREVNFPSVGEFDWWVIPVDGGTAKATGAFAELRKRGFTTDWRESAPRVWTWTQDELIFHGHLGDSMNLWSVPFDRSNFRLQGTFRRLTSGTSFDSHAALMADGRTIFASQTDSSDIWLLRSDTNAANGKLAA